MNQSKCAKCGEKVPYSDGASGRQLCIKCRSISKYRQCYYCKCDYKPKQNEHLCHKCLSQEKTYGKPRRCEICQLKNAFSGVLCIRCSHYKSKFGDAVKCEACHIEAAFVKDQDSRDKVNGRILCWLCTYKYKKENLATYKSKSQTLDVDSSKKSDASKRKFESQTSDNLTTTATSSIKREPFPLLKRSRTAEGSLTEASSLTGIPPEPTGNVAAFFNRFVPSNDQLEVNHKLQEENKGLRRQIQLKDDIINGKERALTDIKAEMLEMRTTHQEKLNQMEATFESESERLKQQIRDLQRENSILERNKRKASRKSTKQANGSGSDNNSPRLF